MKTCRQGAVAWLAVATLLALTSGCGARSAATGEQERKPLSETTVPAASAAVESGASESSNAAPAETGASATSESSAEPTAPGILRAERSQVPLEPEIAEVVKLVESGAGEEVVRAYVGASNVAYDLSLEEIVYLRDIGVPDSVIAAMMRRKAELNNQAADAQNLQTNLVAAVDQLKQAFNPNGTGLDSTQIPAETSAQAPAPQPVQVQEAPPTAPEPVQQFYSDLTPYGNWYQVPSYGWVWQPSVVVVDRTWMPYRHGGRWLWTDSGWYWSSDYSWGWAPFHYGRWCTYPGIGWCWVPGSDWGPSWVTWRYSGSSVGWAPLPPACGWSSGIGLTWYGHGVSVGFGFGLVSSCYTFVPKHAFCYRDVGRHHFDGPRSTTIYKQSTVVNNVIKGNNNVIINNGLGYEKVSSFVRGEVPKARIETLPSNSNRPLRADRLERTKGGNVVYRPTQVDQGAGRPPAIRAEVRPNGTKPTSVTGLSPRNTRETPTRPSSGSRFATSGLDPAKSAGTRSPSPAFPSVSYGPRPVAPANGARPQAGTGNVPKSVESRGATVGNRLNTPVNNPTTLGPTRQTTPVPLADPSRNIPSKYLPQSPRNGNTFVPGKSATETRGITVPSSPTAPTAPVAPMRGNGSGVNNYAPRSLPSRPDAGGINNNTRVGTPSIYSAPKVDYQRSAPTPRMSVPQPSSAPVNSAPRATFSAPAPSVSAPRATMTAPAPATATPSGRGSSGNRGRSGD